MRSDKNQIEMTFSADNDKMKSKTSQAFIDSIKSMSYQLKFTQSGYFNKEEHDKEIRKNNN